MDSIIKTDNDYGQEITTVTVDNFVMKDNINFDSEINIRHPGWGGDIINKIAYVYDTLSKYIALELIEFHVERQLPILSFYYKQDENILYFKSPYRRFVGEIIEIKRELLDLMNAMALNITIIDKDITACKIIY